MLVVTYNIFDAISISVPLSYQNPLYLQGHASGSTQVPYNQIAVQIEKNSQKVKKKNTLTKQAPAI